MNTLRVEGVFITFNFIDLAKESLKNFIKGHDVKYSSEAVQLIQFLVTVSKTFNPYGSWFLIPLQYYIWGAEDITQLIYQSLPLDVLLLYTYVWIGILSTKKTLYFIVKSRFRRSILKTILLSFVFNKLFPNRSMFIRIRLR